MTERALAPLSEHHDIASFDCGVGSLNRYLLNEARSAQKSGASQTHVWTDYGASEVTAYFTLSPTMVEPEGLSRKQQGGVNGRIPAILLGKLALSQPLRGQQLGPELLVDALRTVLAAADLIGGRFIVVDALNEKVHGFYADASFQPLEGSMRLIMKMATARTEFGGF